MALPQVNTPTYELAVPSTDKKLKYRPFLVKEEKILLMAMEAKEQPGIIEAVKQIVKSCTFGKFDMFNAPMFDVEYIFLNIMAKSVGEVSTVNLRCPDDEETFVPTEIDLTKVEVEMDKEHSNKIELTEEMGMIMQYPTLDSFLDMDVAAVNATNMIDIIASCIVQIYDKGGEEVFEAKDSTKKELNDFIESLSTEQFNKIRDYFESMPRLRHEITWKCSKCEKTSPLVLEGLDSFFG